MASPVVLRDAAVALVLTTATAASLVAMTPWPWTITIPASLLLGALALIVDILFFGRPASVRTSKGRTALVALGTVAGIIALGLAFAIGRNTQPASQPHPFIVTSAGGVTTILKAAPFEAAQKNRVVLPGDTVWVDCYVIARDGRWYRLSDNEGWLRDDEVLPAPHTGVGAPPRCPP